MNTTIMALTARQVLGKRRTLLMLPFAGLPILIAVIYRAGDSSLAADEFATQGLLGGVVAALLLPLAALVFGTAAMGAEIDDGTAVYLLSKPIERWRIVFSKLLVAWAATVAMVVPVTFIAGIVALGGMGDDGIPAAFAIAMAVGAGVYCCLFLALSVMTSRAFIIGLIYSFLWEGLITGFFSGTRILSVREYTLGVADALTGVRERAFEANLSGAEAVIMIVLVSGIAIALGIRALRSFEIGEAA